MTPLAILQHVIVWLPLVVGGIFLVRAGLRGRRVNDHPVCRRCRFDLVGLGGGTRPERCPECGTSLTGTTRKARRAIIDGERKRRWWSFSFGVVLLLAGLGTGFWLTYKPLAKFPWTTWAPDWVLAEMVDRVYPTRPGPVLNELLQRLNRQELSHSAARRATRRILAIQADDDSSWDEMLGLFVQRARKLGLLGDEQWHTYVMQSIRPTLQVRIDPTAGHVLELVVRRRACFVVGWPPESQSGLAIPYSTVTQLSIPAAGQVELAQPIDLRSGVLHVAGDQPVVFFSRAIAERFAIGQHTIKQKVRLQFGEEPSGDAGAITGVGLAGHDTYKPSIGSVDVELEALLDVSEGSPLARGNSDSETTVASPLRSVALRVIRIGDTDTSSYQIGFRFDIAEITARQTMRISVRIDADGVYDEVLGNLTFLPEASNQTKEGLFPEMPLAYHVQGPLIKRLWSSKPHTVKVLLTPVSQEAEIAPGFSRFEFGDDHVTIREVPVEYEQR